MEIEGRALVSRASKEASRSTVVLFVRFRFYVVMATAVVMVMVMVCYGGLPLRRPLGKLIWRVH